MKTKTKIAIIVSSALVVLLIALSALSVYSVDAFSKTEKIIKNADFCGVDIGGKTKEEAKQIISESEELPSLKPVKVTFEGKEFSFSPNGAGLEYDTDAIVESAYSIGRGKGFFKNFYEIITSSGKKHIKPVYVENKSNFKNTIDTLANEADIKFENYKIDVYESYADVEISDNKKKIDYDKLLADTYNVIDKEERNITLNVIDINSITADEIYDAIYVEPRNARADKIDGQIKVTPHQIGVLLEKEDIEKELKENKNKFRVKITKKYPEIRNEHLNGDLFNDVLATVKTTYNAGIIGRTQNVTLAAQRINGTILNPGDIFSYNGVVGPRTAKTGFSTATVYTNQGLSEELGGGICQVSSTLYNSVLYADLKIVERRNHMYTVSYVRNGLDATVVYGAIDFRFQNNKQNPVKIVATTGGGVLTVSILGKKENNNTVELYTNTLESYPFETVEKVNDTMQSGETKVSQNGAYGYKITATKVVKDAAGNVIRNEFLGTNVYKPLSKIIEKGPDDTSVDAEVEGTDEGQGGQTDEEKPSDSEENVENEEVTDEEEKVETETEVTEKEDLEGELTEESEETVETESTESELTNEEV